MSYLWHTSNEGLLNNWDFTALSNLGKNVDLWVAYVIEK